MMGYAGSFLNLFAANPTAQRGRGWRCCNQNIVRQNRRSNCMALGCQGDAVCPHIVLRCIDLAFQRKHQAVQLGATGLDQEHAVLERHAPFHQVAVDALQTFRVLDVVANDPSGDFVKAHFS